jgi:hypothetical protein
MLSLKEFGETTSLTSINFSLDTLKIVCSKLEKINIQSFSRVCSIINLLLKSMYKDQHYWYLRCLCLSQPKLIPKYDINICWRDVNNAINYLTKGECINVMMEAELHQALRMLYSFRIRVDILDNLLLVACLKGYSKIISCLRKRLHKEHFDISCDSGRDDSIRAILLCLEVPNSLGKIALADACYQGYSNLVSVLLDNFMVDVYDIGDYLKIAISRGHVGVVDVLLADKRNDIRFISHDAMMLACGRGHFEIVKLFLRDDRFDVNNQYISEAYSRSHEDIVQLLLADKRINNQTRAAYSFNRISSYLGWVTVGLVLSSILVWKR